MFEQLHDDLTMGITIEKRTLSCSPFTQGRSKKEKCTTILIQDADYSVALMDVVFFSGIKPWYHPWIEITYPDKYTIEDGAKKITYFDSITEKTLIQLFCQSLPPAGKIFVSYEIDDETRKGLMMKIPPVLTRLGFLLYNSGCTWFKDWYFPEGGFEGGQKLQGEKSLTKLQKERQLNTILHQVSSFIETMEIQTHRSIIEKRAFSRGKKMQTQRN